MQVDLSAVRSYLMSLQDEICGALEQVDGAARFQRNELPGERGGMARPRVLQGGPVIEKSAVNFSHTAGESLPSAATERRPELAGREFEAASLSLIVHPRNPHAPTTHMNLRLFLATATGKEPVWWFGGGFDLTPYYGYQEDSIHWHREAREACAPFGEDLYPRLKKNCDEYFFLAHRQEARGIGGLFFDDFQQGGFDHSFGLLKSVGDHFLPAYRTILERRKDHSFSEAERNFQLYRRGRYAEFNLLYDRGTRFGLQASGRTESILASLPPVVHWNYEHERQLKEGSREQRLVEDFLLPRDWLAEESRHS